MVCSGMHYDYYSLQNANCRTCCLTSRSRTPCGNCGIAIFVRSLTLRSSRTGCTDAGCASLPASQVSSTTIHYKLNNIYSRNLTATSTSFYLCSKVKSNVQYWSSRFFKYLSVIGCYHPIGQAIPLVNSLVSKVKLTHIIFKAKLLE